jgi:hypothetical protein
LDLKKMEEVWVNEWEEPFFLDERNTTLGIELTNFSYIRRQRMVHLKFGLKFSKLF